MKRTFLILAALTALAALPTTPLTAANYHFSIPKASVTITINNNGTATIHYKIKFTCSPGAHPIDVVDIGMPNLSKHSPVSAAINGKPLPNSAIKISINLKPRGCGYEIHLGSHAIQPGKTGVFEFTGLEKKMVWQDTTDSNQASFRFSPTWFGTRYVSGDTTLSIRVRLPIPKEAYPTAKDRILWQKKGQKFTVKGVMEGEDVASVGWVRNVSMTRENVFGVSFPKKYVNAVRDDSVWDVFLRWFKGNRDVQIVSGFIILLMFGIAFFYTTRMTGGLLFVIMAAGLTLGMIYSVKFHLWLYPVMIALICLTVWWRRHSRRTYFPAELCVEGEGIKRGLTAVQAAVLLEAPLPKIVTMLVFGLLKKGVITRDLTHPGRFKPNGKRKAHGVCGLPDGKKVRLHDNEQMFMYEMKKHHYMAVHLMPLERVLDYLVKNVVNAMKGFSLEDTRAYYRRIVDRAWRQVTAEEGMEAFNDKVGKQLEWLMLDNKWEGEFRTGKHFEGYHPTWWYVGCGRGGAYDVSPSSPIPEPGHVPSAPDATFGDVASSMAGKLESSCAKAAEAADTLGSLTQGGSIDLSGVDKFTSEVLNRLSESGGSGGGFGGGCACACAGCACACACAGGGR